jgi:hypothetical protein
VLERVTLSCLECGSEFKVIKSKAKERKFCSKSCSVSFNNKTPEHSEKMRLAWAKKPLEFRRKFADERVNKNFIAIKN